MVRQRSKGRERDGGSREGNAPPARLRVECCGQPRNQPSAPIQPREDLLEPKAVKPETAPQSLNFLKICSHLKYIYSQGAPTRGIKSLDSHHEYLAMTTIIPRNKNGLIRV